MMPEAVKNLLTTIHRMGNHGPKDLIKKRNSAVHQVARQMERGEVIPLPDIKIATFNIVLLKNSVLTRAVVTRKFQPVAALAACEFNVGANGMWSDALTAALRTRAEEVQLTTALEEHGFLVMDASDLLAPLNIRDLLAPETLVLLDESKNDLVYWRPTCLWEVLFNQWD